MIIYRYVLKKICFLINKVKRFYLLITDVPSPPQGPLHVYGINNDSVTISWSPPEKNGGSVILDYSVEIQDEEKTWKHTATVTKACAKLENLIRNVTYKFRICARNEIGVSLPYIPEQSITIGKTLCKY